MGDKRIFGAHVRWSVAEIEVLTRLYPAAPRNEITAALPSRGMRVIESKANSLGLTRVKAPTRTPDQAREAKRKHMADRRLADPDALKAYQAQHRSKHRERFNAERRAAHKSRIFWTRALRLRGITAEDLASLWKQQRGLCALTGRKLGRTAQIDHRLPLARGGTDDIENLQWTTAEANRAKRDLTDDEFMALCIDSVRWIGARIDKALKESA